MKKQNISRLGFTLIELLVVVLIIGILASVALPQYQKAVEKSRAAEAWVMLQAINEAEKRKNLEEDTSGVLYNLDELDIGFDNVTTNSGNTVNSGFTTKNFGYGIGGDWIPAANTAEPAMAVRLPHTNQAWYGSSKFYYTLSFKNGKKMCANSYGETTDWCKMILGNTISATGCISGGACFSE